MSALAGILVGVAAKVGAPIVKGLLERHIGGAGAEIGGTIIDAIAGKVGVPADELGTVPQTELERAVAEVERETPELIAAYTEQQRQAHALMLAEMDKGPAWAWAWRPAWMWLLAFLWIYTIVARPIVNAIAGASIETVDVGTLMALTGAYLALYMGGHTAKDIFARGREGGRG